jgi:hypothetical protein
MELHSSDCLRGIENRSHAAGINRLENGEAALAASFL